MSVELCNFGDLPPGKQGEVAGLVSAYTKGELGEKPQMLPVQSKDILQKYAGAVALQGEVVAGYVGATPPIEHNGSSMPEVGSLWVPEQYRKAGIAGRLVTAISTALLERGDTPYAFCNPLSTGVFVRSGYAEADAKDIPPAAFEGCAGCPMRPSGDNCCDKIYVMKGDSNVR